MKFLKVLLSLAVTVMMLLATALSALAIGFVAEDAYESVFVVYSGNSLGSGFALGKNCIVTNAHVIDDKNDVVVKTYGATEYKAFVIGMDDDRDIAVLGVENADFPYLSIADVSSMNTGDDIYAIGAPKSMSYTLTKGVISAKERKVGRYNYIQIDAAINEGNSGGPLLNDNGDVLGVNTLKMSDSEGIGLAIPINVVIDYIKELNISVDENGNVSEIVTEPVRESSTNPQSTQGNLTVVRNDTKVNLVLAVLAVLSALFNIILLVWLISIKSKYNNLINVTVKTDPSERTDFDIDILE